MLSGGAHFGGKDLVSAECCAVFQGGYRSSVAGPNVAWSVRPGWRRHPGRRKYSQGLLDSIYKAYAGGVNQLVWHGYAYRDAPTGVGTTRSRRRHLAGLPPWDIFGVLNVNDEFGPRQASWADYAKINDSLARTQLVLRQGRATVDLGVYYEDLGLIGSSVSGQQSPQHMLGTDSATSSAGYTYDYVAPDLIEDPSLEADEDGGLFGDRSDYEAIVLNNQATIGLHSAERLLDLAEGGLRIFVVGDQPGATTGAEPDAEHLAEVVERLLAQPTVIRVAEEAELPAALQAAGIRPTVAPETPTSALGLVRREAKGITYDFAYNRSGEEVVQDLTPHRQRPPVPARHLDGQDHAHRRVRRQRDEPDRAGADRTLRQGRHRDLDVRCHLRQGRRPGPGARAPRGAQRRGRLGDRRGEEPGAACQPRTATSRPSSATGHAA